MRKEFWQRLAKEYRYSVTKMQQSPQPVKKLFYFSAFASETQRVLNWEWDTDLALIHLVVHQVHTQINPATQAPIFGQLLPIDGATVYEKLTQVASDLAAYFEKEQNEDGREELLRILGHLAEINYVASGNGSYLYEKGAFKL